MATFMLTEFHLLKKQNKTKSLVGTGFVDEKLVEELL